MSKRYVEVWDTVEMTMPYSEVCMHMHVAGRRMLVEVVAPNAAQLRELDGKPFSFPITTGEAGLYRDDRGLYIVE